MLENLINSKNPPEVNEAVKKAKVAILGLGGLGSNIAMMLTRVGIGSLFLIDFDTVEASNLNRQIYTLNDIGELKTKALSRYLTTINPFIEIKTLNLKLKKENLNEVLKDESIICEAFDGASEKAMIAEFATQNMDKIFILASGMGGYGSSNLVKTTKFGSNLYICGDRENDMSLGLVASRVMLCAAHQANMIVRIIMKDFES